MDRKNECEVEERRAQLERRVLSTGEAWRTAMNGAESDGIFIALHSKRVGRKVNAGLARESQANLTCGDVMGGCGDPGDPSGPEP